MESKPYVFKRKTTYFFIGILIAGALFPVLYFLKLMNEQSYYYMLPAVAGISIYLGYTILKQISISSDNIEIINIFGKKIIRISDIVSVKEGVSIGFRSVSPKSIIFNLKEGSKYLIPSRYLDKKTKEILLSIRR
jgi:hypothetical protein